MRTNIVIEDTLISDAMRVSGAKTKREVVELGLKTLVRLSDQSRLRDLRGALEWRGDLDVLRTDS